jgi:hypothetical protein
MKHNLRTPTGQFAPISAVRPLNVVPGRLYAWKGIPVRAKAGNANGYRHVSAHKVLNGFVPEAELTLIGKNDVQAYLKKA